MGRREGGRKGGGKKGTGKEERSSSSSLLGTAAGIKSQEGPFTILLYLNVVYIPRMSRRSLAFLGEIIHPLSWPIQPLLLWCIGARNRPCHAMPGRMSDGVCGVRKCNRSWTNISIFYVSKRGHVCMCVCVYVYASIRPATWATDTAHSD